ncbi:hypothetical protein WMY93_015251 [Mugilogobius chulae]|uniref:Anoctamin dimerisation domain-containing protein n=1 Tax=Mugilogobius chulae TaxID=88201 RepID=A0AAW0NU85_9GOBI
MTRSHFYAAALIVNAENLNWSEKLLQKLSIPNILSNDVPQPPPDYYTCQFRANKLHRFLGSNERDNFFTPTQRHQVLYEILSRTPYGSVKRGQVGINRLINDSVFSAAFPLHQGSVEPPSGHLSQLPTLRQILFSHWAAWSCWAKYQPLDHIREYFGEKIALYFAWLGMKGLTVWSLKLQRLKRTKAPVLHAFVSMASML